MRIDMPWALVLPIGPDCGATNWLPTHGYVDVSNASFGVTCASARCASSSEVGGITANLFGGLRLEGVASAHPSDSGFLFLGPQQHLVHKLSRRPEGS